jgi:hypothetical protein
VSGAGRFALKTLRITITIVCSINANGLSMTISNCRVAPATGEGPGGFVFEPGPRRRRVADVKLVLCAYKWVMDKANLRQDLLHFILHWPCIATRMEHPFRRPTPAFPGAVDAQHHASSARPISTSSNGTEYAGLTRIPISFCSDRSLHRRQRRLAVFEILQSCLWSPVYLP